MTAAETDVAVRLFKAIDEALVKEPQMVFSRIQTYEAFLRAVQLKQSLKSES